MPNKDNFWVSRREDGRWGVKREGAQRASNVCDTQQEAWEQAKGRAKTARGEAFLKGRDGRIRERNTCGKDPFPPRG